MELTKEYLLNKIIENYSSPKLYVEFKPDVVHFNLFAKNVSAEVRLLKDRMICFCATNGLPSTKNFDITEDEFENVLEKTCKW